MPVRYLDFGVGFDPTRFGDVMVKSCEAKRAKLGDDVLLCATSEKMITRTIDCLGRDRSFSIETPPNCRPGMLWIDGITGEMSDICDNAVEA